VYDQPDVWDVDARTEHARRDQHRHPSCAEPLKCLVADLLGYLLMERLTRERRCLDDRLDSLYVVAHDYGLACGVDDRLYELDQLPHLIFELGSSCDDAIFNVGPHRRRSNHRHLVGLPKHTAHQLCLVTRR
jgi:hypothetical protein